MGDPVEVVVICHDGGVPVPRQADELHVYLCHVRDVIVDELDVDQWLLLQKIEHLQPPAATISAQGVTGVGDVLQLGQHKMGHHHMVAEKPSLGDVHDATVDDHAGVEQHGGGHAWRAGPSPRCPGWAQNERHHLVAPVEAQGDAPVGKNERHHQRDHEAEIPGQLGQKKPDDGGQQQPDEKSDGGRHQIR